MNTTVFSALAEPNRFRIIELLRDQPRSVNQVAEMLQLRQPQASKHLQVLSQAGLVTVQPAAQQRVYSLNPESFLRLEDWAESFQQHWEQKLDNLAIFLEKGNQ